MTVSPRPWWQRLTLRQQQLILLACGSGLGMLALVLGGSLLTGWRLRAQLGQQAQVELAWIRAAYGERAEQLLALSQTAVQHPDVSVTLRLEVPTPFLERFIQSQVDAYGLPLGVLVTRQRQIVSNIRRLGETFDPAAELVEQVMEQGEPQAALVLLPWQTFVDAQSSLPEGFSNQDGLVQLLVTPVRDPGSQEVLGAWILADLIHRNPRVPEGVLAQLPRGGDGLVAVLVRGGAGTWETALSLGPELPDLPARLSGLQQTPTWQGTLPAPGQTLIAASQTLTDFNGDPVMVLVRGIPTRGMAWGGYPLGLAGLVGVVGLGGLVVFALSQEQLRGLQRVQRLVAGERPLVYWGDLAAGIEAVVARVQQQEQELEDLQRQRQQALAEEQQQRQRLQGNLMTLIVAMDTLQKGNLAANAPVSEDEVGSVADAFNAIVGQLRQWLARVTRLSQTLTSLNQHNQTTTQHLLTDLGSQAEHLQTGLGTLAGLETGLETLLQTSAEAERINSGLSQDIDQEQSLIQQAVQELGRIRATVADMAKQTKRLGESAQEISQMIGVVLEIADRTNLLAFNAAIEAARAGEQGQGFRQVAEEVRRLAQQVGELGQAIAARVRDVQQQAGDINVLVETNTGQVVSTTQVLSQSQSLGQALQTQEQQLQTTQAALHTLLDQTQAQIQTLKTAWHHIHTHNQASLQDSHTLAETLATTAHTLAELHQALNQWQLQPAPVSLSGSSL
ncbi:MAG: methyl-accepting chemotaxis protein [Thermostichales cyanobacterium GMQP_bins_62]